MSDDDSYNSGSDHPHFIACGDEGGESFIYIYEDERDYPGAALVAIRMEHALQIAGDIMERFADGKFDTNDTDSDRDGGDAGDA